MTTIPTALQLTNHGRQRLDQRGVSLETVNQVRRLGKVIHKQQLKFLYLPKSKVKLLPLDQQKAVSNLIIVTNEEMDTLITCYKHGKAVHKIHKKPKRRALHDHKHPLA